MSPANRPADLPGRLVALLVFLSGVGILIYVFVAALHLLQSPVPGLETLNIPSAPPPTTAGLSASLIGFARTLLLLGLMTLAGSLLASRGAHLYFATVYSPFPAPSPGVKNGQGKPSDAVKEEAKVD